MAVRAAASLRESRWTGRQTRVCRYDVVWDDGRVDFNVNLVKTMYRGSPADFELIQTTVNTECPEIGTGPWVDRQGQVVDGPAAERPDWLKDGVGRPVPYRTDPNAKKGSLREAVDVSWRIGPGLVGIAIGVLLLTRSAGLDALSVLGTICVLIGLASLASLLTGLRHR